MKTKSFDCVEMKRRIQERLIEEMSGLTPEQQQQKTEQDIANDPVLGPLWRNKRHPPRTAGESTSDR